MLALVLLLPSFARAQAATTRRPRPVFDGRARPRPAPAAALLWIPRVLMAPVVVALEAVRQPAGLVLRSEALYRLLLRSIAAQPAAGPTRVRAASPHVFPIFALDLGRRPWVGLSFGITLPPDARQMLTVSASTGGARFYVADVADRVRVTRAIDVGLHAAYGERPDLPIDGPPGPGTATPARRYFWLRRVTALASTTLRTGSWASLTVDSGFRWTAIELPTDLPWLAQSRIPAHDAYGAFVSDAELTLDTRGDAARRAGGVRLDARLHHGVDLDAPASRRWVVGDVLAGGYLEVMRPGRQLGLELFLADSQPLGSSAIPLAELPTLGGDGALRGFLDGRFRGPSAASAALIYRWPVWVLLEASTRLSVGNTFGPGFEGFAPRALFASWDVSLHTVAGPVGGLEFLFGLGSTRFDAPRFGIENVRLLAALTRSF